MQTACETKRSIGGVRSPRVTKLHLRMQGLKGREHRARGKRVTAVTWAESHRVALGSMLSAFQA
jgi:hypothetical protein